MSPASDRPPQAADRGLPWALEVLREEYDALQAHARRAARAPSQAQTEVITQDLLRAVDRHLRLEHEVFHPALEVAGVDTQAGRSAHAELRAALERAVRADASGRTTPAALAEAIATYREVQERKLFPQTTRLAEADMAALGLELDEARQRMRGAYGV